MSNVAFPLTFNNRLGFCFVQVTELFKAELALGAEAGVNSTATSVRLSRKSRQSCCIWFSSFGENSFDCRGLVLGKNCSVSRVLLPNASSFGLSCQAGCSSMYGHRG